MSVNDNGSEVEVPHSPVSSDEGDELMKEVEKPNPTILLGCGEDGSETVYFKNVERYFLEGGVVHGLFSCVDDDKKDGYTHYFTTTGEEPVTMEHLRWLQRFTNAGGYKVPRLGLTEDCDMKRNLSPAVYELVIKVWDGGKDPSSEFYKLLSTCMYLGCKEALHALLVPATTENFLNQTVVSWSAKLGQLPTDIDVEGINLKKHRRYFELSPSDVYRTLLMFPVLQNFFAEKFDLFDAGAFMDTYKNIMEGVANRPEITATKE
jgi:hypothetical protein